MKKLSFYSFVACILLCSVCLPMLSSGQADTTSHDSTSFSHIGCGANATYFQSMAVDSAGRRYTALLPYGYHPPSGVGSYAITNCSGGVIDLYIEDINSHTGAGFDDPTMVGTMTLGALRIRTFCAVLNYIQSTFDFTGISSTDHIRIYVCQSYAPGTALTAPTGGPTSFSLLAAAAFGMDTTVTTGITSGLLNYYATHAADHASPSDYHAQVIVNFDHTYNAYLGTSTPVSWQDDYLAPFRQCNTDLFSALLHEVTHAMGFESFINFPVGLAPGGPCGCAYGQYPIAGATPLPGALTGPNLFTDLDWAMYGGGSVFPVVTGMQKLITGTMALPSINPLAPAANNNYWVNNNAAPDNYPVFSATIDTNAVPSYFSHLDDQPLSYTLRERVSPGDRQGFVMGPYGYKGALKRTYTKGEIQTLVNTLHYTYTGVSSAPLTNHLPFSKKMAGLGITAVNFANFTEDAVACPADYTIVNNVGTVLDIYLTDPCFTGDLTDADPGDTITIDTTTLVNFRGCSNGGINHNALTVVSPTHLRYAPRPNFYGRANFGFNITDGRERGSFRVVTIDVSPGTQVSCALYGGGNMVCNPGFEEGSEVLTTANKTIPNSILYYDGNLENKWQGISFSDSHPYCFHSNIGAIFTRLISGAVVVNSYIMCAADTILTTNDGSEYLTAPYGGGLSYAVDNIAPVSGNRYQQFQHAAESYYYLDTFASRCTSYVLAFDVHKEYDLNNILYCSGCNADFTVKFADHIGAFNFTAPAHSFPATYSGWSHVTDTFYYCGTNPSNILYLSNPYGDFLVDNLSLVPIPSPAMAVAITGTVNPCATNLSAVVTNAGCTPSVYSWSPATGLSCTTCASPSAYPSVTTVYTLTVTDACGTRSAVATYTVNPTGPSPINGPSTVCIGSTVTLSSAPSGGTWTSSNPAIATIGSATGIATGVASGVVNITYSIGGCYVTAPLGVNPLPAGITGTLNVCVGTTRTLTDGTAGGTWTSGNTAIATAGSATGIITGISPGVAAISYTLPTGCYRTVNMTVNPLPSVITGAASVCVGATVTLSDTITGGVWASSNTAIGSIGSTTGMLIGISSGAVTITYTLPTGCRVTTGVTVNPLPAPIGGAAAICIGGSATLTDTATGGTWTSGNTAIATVGSATGTVTGVAAGTVAISYTLPTGCYATTIITVSPLPAAISGATSVCTGSNTTLTDATTGGTWSSSNTAIGSIGSSSGIVTGISSGTATITYALPTGCYTTTTITVNPLPAAISGTLTVCIGATTKLTDGTGGGTWSSSNTTIASIGTGGIVTGVAAGMDTIYYTLGTGCFTAVVVTVTPLPAVIGGTTSVCVGATTTLTDATTGGVWSSSNTAIAAIGSSSGMVSGVAAGTATISYIIGTGCFTTVTVTVNPLPKPVAGTLSVCVGATTALSDITAGGTWSSSSTAIATIGSSSGIATGVSSGTATISYTLGTGCFSTAILTVNPLPAAISGSPLVCVALTETLTDATAGGSWASGNTAVATIGSGSGLVTGVAAGTAGITYTLPTGCYTSMTMTVITAPAIITGTPLSVCPGNTTTLSDATPGGSWSSSSGAIATVGTGGVVFGVASGTATITYSLGGSCYATTSVTVETAPAAYSVVGGGAYCTGSPVVHVGLSGSQTGVKYQLYLGGSPVGSPVTGAGLPIDFGVVTAPGIYTVIATDTVTGCTNTMTGSATVAINPLPSPITGPSGVCIGQMMTLTDTTSGGTWSSSTPTIATVGVGTGIVTGVSLGTDTIRYTVTGTGCSQIKIITVNPLPSPITGLVNLCHGIPLTLHDATGGGTWSSTNTHIATIGSTSGIVTWDSVGVDTIIYKSSAGCGVMTVIQAWDTACSPCNAFGDSFTVIGGSGIIPSNLGRGNYFINNSVMVRNIDTFANAMIMIGAGDSIIIDTTAMLTLDSTHLFSLCNEWACMKLKPGGTHSGRLAVLSHSLIEDAMCAVYIPNAVTPSGGLIFKSEASIFNRNMIGVFIQNYKPAIAGYPFLVHNTAFISRDLQTGNPGFPKQWPPTLGIGGLKNYWNPGDTFATPLNINDTTPGLGYAYPGVYCYGGIAPIYGIKLDGVGTDLLPERYTGEPIPTNYYEITIGDTTTADSNSNQNLFDGLQYGIYSVNSNLTSINNFFADLFSSRVYTRGGSLFGGGDGIYAAETDDVANQCRLRVYTPPGAQYNNRFYNFNNGVECSNMFQVIGNNTFMMNKGFGTRFGPPMGSSGYYISTAKYDSILIDYDTVTNVMNGIAVWMAYDPTVTITHGGTLDTIPSQYMGVCNIDSNLLQIHPVWTAPLTTQQMNMGISYQNTVTVPAGSVIAYGNNLNINYNTIHDAYNAIYVNGYWAPKGIEPYTSANTVYLRQQATSRPQYGINVTNSQNSRTYYNNVSGTMPYSDTTNMMRAFYAASNSLMDLGCNDEAQIGRGYEFYLTSPGMEWHSNNMTDNAKGMVLNGAVIGPQHIGLTTMNNAWYGSWPASTLQTYVYNGANAVTSPFWVAGTTLTDPTNNLGHPPTTAYGPTGTILVLPTTSVAPCLPIYGGSLADTSNLLSQIAMQHVDYTLNVVPSNWMGQYSLWKSILMDTTLVDSSAVIARFAAMADSMSRFKYLTSIEYALSVGDLATANYLLGLHIDSMTNTGTDSATQVKIGDDTTADNIVENYQQYYGLYLKYVSGTMAGTDSLAIMALAQLCPERNGTVVFQARALYSYIYADLSMFNDDSCLSADTTYVASRHNPNIKQGTDGTNVTQQYTLRPNPSDGNITLQQAVPDGRPVTSEIWNAVGASIFKSQLYFTNGIDNLHVRNAAPGLYLLRLTDSQNRQFILKFVIE